MKFTCKPPTQPICWGVLKLCCQAGCHERRQAYRGRRASKLFHCLSQRGKPSLDPLVRVTRAGLSNQHSRIQVHRFQHVPPEPIWLQTGSTSRLLPFVQGGAFLGLQRGCRSNTCSGVTKCHWCRDEERTPMNSGMQAGHLQMAEDWKSSNPPHCHSCGAGDTEMCCPLLKKGTAGKFAYDMFQQK